MHSDEREILFKKNSQELEKIIEDISTMEEVVKKLKEMGFSHNQRRVFLFNRQESNNQEKCMKAHLTHEEQLAGQRLDLSLAITTCSNLLGKEEKDQLINIMEVMKKESAKHGHPLDKDWMNQIFQDVIEKVKRKSAQSIVFDPEDRE